MNRAAGQGYPAARGDSSGGLGEQGRPFLPADPLIGRAGLARKTRIDPRAAFARSQEKAGAKPHLFNRGKGKGPAWHCHAAPSLWALFIRRRIHEGIKRGYVLSDIEILHHRTRQRRRRTFRQKAAQKADRASSIHGIHFCIKNHPFRTIQRPAGFRRPLYSAAASTASITTPSAATPASGLEGAAAAAPAVCPPSGVAGGGGLDPRRPRAHPVRPVHPAGPALVGIPFPEGVFHRLGVW